LVIDESKEGKLLANKFKEIHSWQLDEPNISFKTDLLSKAFNWFDIAQLVRVIIIILKKFFQIFSFLRYIQINTF